MWANPTYVEDRHVHLVVLDFESFCQPLISGHNGKTSYDCKLFALVILLSSTVFFHSRFKFEEKSIEQLSMLLDLQKYIKIQPAANPNAEVTP